MIKIKNNNDNNNNDNNGCNQKSHSPFTEIAQLM